MHRRDCEDYIGTCQACFGEFKVDGGTTRIALHGYSRPGHGYIEGGCEGTGHLPFEHSCALTRTIAASARHFADDGAAHLERLRSGTIETLDVYKDVYDHELRKLVVKVDTFTPEHRKWPDVLADAIRKAQAEAFRREAHAAFLEYKVEHWTRGTVVGIDVPVTGRIRALKDAFDPERHDDYDPKPKAPKPEKDGRLSVIMYFPRHLADPEKTYPDNDYKAGTVGVRALRAVLDDGGARAFFREALGAKRFTIIWDMDYRLREAGHRMAPAGDRVTIDAAEVNLDWNLDACVAKLLPFAERYSNVARGGQRRVVYLVDLERAPDFHTLMEPVGAAPGSR